MTEPVAAPAPIHGSGWLLEVKGQPVRLELTFHEGRTFEVGLPVGAYEHVGTSFIASIGEDVRVIADLDNHNGETLPARILSWHDGGTLEERGVLCRLAWH